MNAPTLRDVAREAGVSLASASYALRRHPTVSAATHRRVEEVAARLGYRLNPQLAAFMQARRVGRSMQRDAAIALVHSGPAADLNGSYYAGTCARGLNAVAQERGYAIDVIRWQNDRKDATGRLERMLIQRGIRGLILVPPHNVGRWTLPLDWTRFFGVTLDYSLTGAPVHRVMDHHAVDLGMALEKIKEAGYRRPGLVMNALNNERTHKMRLGAFLAGVRNDFPEAAPPLMIGGGQDVKRQLTQWMKIHRPDVILSPESNIRQKMIEGRLMQAKDTAFVSLALYSGSSAGFTGVVIDAEGIGRTAGFLLMSLLEDARNAKALKPQTILLESAWTESRESFPPVNVRGR
ncbi:MAG: LacI family transcriptional regulator [Rariglobus sp.]|jgi:LacI family transcriptional regulator|nr:LacI family transcriptional regulator [Rariglobus sp.]